MINKKLRNNSDSHNSYLNDLAHPISEKVVRNVNLRDLTTMKIGGIANLLIEIENEEELFQVYDYAKYHNLKLFPLGGGSNTIFSDKNHSLLIIKMKNKGILKTYEGNEMVNIEVQAGEDWDELVDWTVQNDLSGLENLSLIPGTVGASPIQNIGAYGSEIKDTLIKVKILDLKNGKVFEILNQDCDFSYRNSIFKENLGQFIIISVFFNLKKVTKPIKIPEYKDVQLYFLGTKKNTVSLKQIRKAIIEIRESKIPDPEIIPNSGSFFKNPIVTDDLASRIGFKYPEMPYYKLEENKTKLYAGWLIEKAGLKGQKFGNLTINEKNALILTNPEQKSDFLELTDVIEKINLKLKNKFGLELEVEPNLVF